MNAPHKARSKGYRYRVGCQVLFRLLFILSELDDYNIVFALENTSLGSPRMYVGLQRNAKLAFDLEAKLSSIYSLV